MAQLFDSFDIFRFAELTLTMAVLIALVVGTAFFLARAIGRRSIGLRHCIWVTSLCFVSASPMVVGLAQVTELPLSRQLQLMANNVTSLVGGDTVVESEGLPNTTPAELQSPSRLRSNPHDHNPEAVNITFAHEFEYTSVSNDAMVAAGENGTASSARTEPIGSRRSHNLLAAFGCLWLAGTFFGVVRFIHGWLQVRRYRTTALPSTDVIQRELMGDISVQLQLRCPPTIKLLSDGTAPFTAGVFRPTVYVSSCLTDRQADLRSVLLHECSHVARNHHWIGLLQRLVQIVVWWHPAVHFLNNRLTNVMELACDSDVVQTEDRAKYAEFLFRIAQQFQSPGNASLCMVRRHSTLEKRISHLLTARERAVSVSRIGLLGIVLIFSLTSLFAAAFATPAGTENKEPPSTLTFADDIEPQTTPNYRQVWRLLDTIPSSAVSYVHYQGATDTIPANKQNREWFAKWITENWGLNDSTLEQSIGLSLSQWFAMADERESICLSRDLETGDERLLIALGSRFRSPIELLTQLEQFGLRRVDDAESEEYYTCRHDGADVFVAYRFGMCLASESLPILKRMLRCIDTRLAMQLVDKSEHIAIAEATQVNSRGALVTWYKKVRPPKQLRRNHAPRAAAVAVSRAIDKVFQQQVFPHIKAVGGTIEMPATGEHSMVHHTMIYGRPQNDDKPIWLFLDGPTATQTGAPQWVPSNVQTYSSFSVVPAEYIRGLNPLLQGIAAVTDETFGEKGFFEDLLASLREDPNGPMVDLQDLVQNLGQELHVARILDASGRSHHVASFPITGEAAIRKLIDKLTASDPTAKKHETENATVWVFGGDQKGEIPGYLVIIGGHLLLTSNQDIITAITSSVDDTSGRLVDSQLFQRLSRDIDSLHAQPSARFFARGGSSLEPPFFVRDHGDGNTVWNRFKDAIIGSTIHVEGPTAISICDHKDGLTLHGLQFRNVSSLDPESPSPDRRAFPVSHVNSIRKMTATECVRSAIQNSQPIRTVARIRRSGPDGTFMSVAKNSNRQEVVNAVNHAISLTLRLYCHLYFCERNLAAAVEGRNTALETWRQQNPETLAETQCREQYFFFRAQIEKAVREYHKASGRLTHTAGLSSPSDMLISTTDIPVLQNELPLDAAKRDTAFKKGLELNPEFQEQLERTRQVLRHASSENNSDLEINDADELLQRIKTVETEKKRLEDLRDDTRSQFNELVEALENAQQIRVTSRLRQTAAEAELKATTNAFNAGTASTDLLLDAQRRRVEAAISFRQNEVRSVLADINLSIFSGDLYAGFVEIRP